MPKHDEKKPHHEEELPEDHRKGCEEEQEQEGLERSIRPSSGEPEPGR